MTIKGKPYKSGHKCDTQDGSFSRRQLKHRRGDGFTPRKARRLINKRIRQQIKKDL